jgi:hypothetical protein
MKLNWKAIIVGFAVAFSMALFSGLYFPKMGLIGAVIGGFIAVYMVEVSYTNGILYGGLPTSIAGLTSASLLVFLSQNQTNIQVANSSIISPETLNVFLYIVGAISGFILFLFIGIICGIIAVVVKKKTNKKFVYLLIAVVVIVFVFILSNVIHVGAILSTAP